ncbi:MAG: hypothetical protein NXI08_06210 [bacterium]|nr:hypothetical protein [bacterium]
MENYEMLWIIITAGFTFLISGFSGFKRLLYLYQLNLRNIAISAILGLLVLTLLLFLYRIEFMSEQVGAAIITNVYASVAGFFGGAAFQQYQTKAKAGHILYSNRSFLSDHASVIVAIAIILYGLYRTSIFTQLPITPIRVSSGLSFIAFGFWGMTLRLVPEFRQKGIILLDVLIDWKDFLNYQWFYEEVIEIEYEKDETILFFKTHIPPEDQLAIEDVLRAKMKEKMESS